MATFDRDRVVDCMFDPVTSSLIAELEDGEKECSSLAAAASVSEGEVSERLGYLIDAGFISRRTDGGRTFLSANTEELNKIVGEENFDSAIEGLEKMDSYLN